MMTISGFVKDFINERPLSFSTVQVKRNGKSVPIKRLSEDNATLGVVVNNAGGFEFTYNPQDNDTVEVRHMGYETVSFPVSQVGVDPILIRLVSSNVILPEVVLTPEEETVGEPMVPVKSPQKQTQSSFFKENQANLALVAGGLMLATSAYIYFKRK